MRVCQRQRRHLCESLREWLLVPPFTRAFLKSPSSRGLSAVAELLVNSNTMLMANLLLFLTTPSVADGLVCGVWFVLIVCCNILFRNTRQEGLLSLTAQRAACETWNAHATYCGRNFTWTLPKCRYSSMGSWLRYIQPCRWKFLDNETL